MRANHSPLQFFGLLATASALACGVCANAALAVTMASTTEPNSASVSVVPVGTGSASEAGPRTLVDATRATADSKRTSRTLRSVITTATTGGFLSPTGGPPEGGSATRGGQVIATEAPAKTAPPTPAGRSNRVDVVVTPLIGGRGSARAPIRGTAPSATTTNTAPPDPSLADSAGRTPVATQVSRRRAPSPQPQATPLTATPALATTPLAPRAAATEVPITRPPATPPVAPPPSATSPVATDSVATDPVATDPVAPPPLSAQSAPPSPGKPGRKLIQPQTSMTRWLRVKKDEAARLVTPTHAQPSTAPSHPLSGLAAGKLGSAFGSPGVLAGDANSQRGSANAAAAPRRPEESPKRARVARAHAATSSPIPQVLPSVPPLQTRLPLGGAAAASGGAVGSVAPSVVAEVDALALMVAAILLVRFSLDRAAWRSALLVSRLEHPG
jgi:hypothetical protein